MSDHEGQGTSLHAACVAIDGAGLAIMGDSGSGKSRLALELMALGADLVADDRILLERDGGRIFAAAPDTIHGLIEARGVGLLRLPALKRAPLKLVVSLDEPAPERMPETEAMTLLGVDLPVYELKNHPFAAAALIALIRAGARPEW